MPVCRLWIPSCGGCCCPWTTDDEAAVRAALGDLGYRLVPEEPLWESYDGNTPGLVPYWWARFFGYL